MIRTEEGKRRRQNRRRRRRKQKRKPCYQVEVAGVGRRHRWVVIAGSHVAGIRLPTVTRAPEGREAEMRKREVQRVKGGPSCREAIRVLF